MYAHEVAQMLTAELPGCTQSLRKLKLFKLRDEIVDYDNDSIMNRGKRKGGPSVIEFLSPRLKAPIGIDDTCLDVTSCGSVTGILNETSNKIKRL